MYSFQRAGSSLREFGPCATLSPGLLLREFRAVQQSAGYGKELTSALPEGLSQLLLLERSAPKQMHYRLH
jgi:hypothetical protein